MKARTQNVPRAVDQLTCKHCLTTAHCLTWNASRLRLGKAGRFQHCSKEPSPPPLTATLESLGMHSETPQPRYHQHDHHVTPTHHTQHCIPRACTTLSLLLVSLSKPFAMHTRIRCTSTLLLAKGYINIQNQTNKKILCQNLGSLPRM